VGAKRRVAANSCAGGPWLYFTADEAAAVEAIAAD
jgi:hypothetical protein